MKIIMNKITRNQTILIILFLIVILCIFYTYSSKNTENYCNKCTTQCNVNCESDQCKQQCRQCILKYCRAQIWTTKN